MSTQKGNSNRSRPQKYKNHTSFKNDLYDKSHKTKAINNIEVANVCERCKKIIEWKIKYKKYKLLKAPSKCIKCEEKVVKHAYHNMCIPCSKQFRVCPKCNEKGDVIEEKPSKEESVKLDAELQALLKSLPERKRRSFIRYMNHNAADKKSKSKKSINVQTIENKLENENDEEEDNDKPQTSISRDDLLSKLKSLVIKEGEDDKDFDSDDPDFLM